MPRKPPPDAPQWKAPPAASTLVLTLKTVTPMFGGGYENRSINERDPIRSAAIRGHLRYWWRATAGASETDSEALFAREARLWGSMTTPGRVSVRTETLEAGETRTHSKIAPRATREEGPLEGYFLFPFQEEKKPGGQKEAKGRVDVKFQVTITCDEDNIPEIERTLRAWLLMGGVGARTRRGCGALKGADEATRERFSPPGKTIESWLQELSGPTPTGAPQWTTLTGGRILLGPMQGDPMEAWRMLGRFWSRFRKGHVPPYDYRPDKDGRFHDYPKLKAAAGSMEGQLHLVKPYLGLPIIYQSVDGCYAPEITGAQTDRMASPVILKPIFVGRGGLCYPMVAILRAPPPRAIRVDGTPFTLARAVNNPNLNLPESDPVMVDLNATNSLSAVLSAARKEWKNPSEISLRVSP